MDGKGSVTKLRSRIVSPLSPEYGSRDNKELVDPSTQIDIAKIINQIRK